MNTYLLLLDIDGQWTVATRDGKLVTTEDPNFWTNKEMPLIAVHEKCTVPTEDAFTGVNAN